MSRLSEFAAEGLSATDIPNFSEEPEIVSFFANIVGKCEAKRSISSSDLSLATGFVAGILVYKNLHRVGAVVGMKVQEIQQAKYKERGDHQFLVVSVKEHKTASSGRATVVAKDGGDITIVQKYQKLIRPRITSDPDGYFLVNSQGTKIHNLNQLLQCVAALGQGKFLTATQARKGGGNGAHTRGVLLYRGSWAEQAYGAFLGHKQQILPGECHSRRTH